MRVEAKLALISLTIIGLAASCGGRSGIELAEYDDLLDASPSFGGGVIEGGKKDTSTSDTSTDDVSSDVSSDVSNDTSVPPDGPPPKDAPSDAKDFFDTLPPLPDSGPIGECLSCLQGQCGDQINACYNDATCWSGIQCAATSCFTSGGGGSGGSGSGGIDYACLMECFDNDMTAIMTALQMFQCITGTCGELCGMSGQGGSGGGGFQYGQFRFYQDPTAVYFQPGARYIGAVRVPEPCEVSSIPWLADVLNGRTPNPLPPSAR